MANTVLVTREPPIAVVQLNRPDVLNALNEEVLGELVAALADLDDDGRPRRYGDGFRYEGRDLETARSGRQHFTVSCVALNEFVAIGPAETRITQTHTHTMTGGKWLWRRNRRRSHHRRHPRRSPMPSTAFN